MHKWFINNHNSDDMLKRWKEESNIAIDSRDVYGDGWVTPPAHLYFLFKQVSLPPFTIILPLDAIGHRNIVIKRHGLSTCLDIHNMQ